MAENTPIELLGATFKQVTASATGALSAATLENDGEYLAINLADLLPDGELLAGEADETNGNGVKVAWALVKTICDNLNGLGDDASDRMTAYEGAFSTNTDGTVSRSYSISFTYSVGDIADEPA